MFWQSLSQPRVNMKCVGWSEIVSQCTKQFAPTLPQQSKRTWIWGHLHESNFAMSNSPRKIWIICMTGKGNDLLKLYQLQVKKVVLHGSLIIDKSIHSMCDYITCKFTWQKKMITTQTYWEWQKTWLKTGGAFGDDLVHPEREVPKCRAL